MDDGNETTSPEATADLWKSQAASLTEDRALLAQAQGRQAQAREAAGQAKVRQAMRMRIPQSAPQPTGVHLRTSKGYQMVFDDGSVRNIYQRAPGFSGRQFRKGRKAAQRAAREAERRALQPIIDLLPAIPGHRHTIGENLLPSCGCTLTPDALDKLRALVAGAGTALADESVNPERQLDSQE